MAHLRVRALGKLSLQNGDRRLDHFPTKRAEELLGYLLINQKAQLPREELVELLWPDGHPSNGRANLSTTVWRLRTAFDQIGIAADDYVRSGRDWISFAPQEPVSVDCADFEKFLVNSNTSVKDSERENNLRSAVAIYEGVFCDGIYAEWCLLERERLERQFLKALGRLMRIHIDRQEYQQAIAHGKKILERDYLREEVHRALMLCYWKLGRRAESVRQFQKCAQLLQRELNILPMPETIALYRVIIEERVADYSTNGRLPSAYEERLDAAFEAFLSAAEELNTILEEKKQSREPITSY